MAESKKRPSLVVATLKGDHVILSQITGQPRPDPDLLELNSKDFQKGGISRDSFIRPSVLFTIHKSQIEYKAGKKGLLGLFMGEVMKLSKGKADPKVTTALLTEILEKN